MEDELHIKEINLQILGEFQLTRTQEQQIARLLQACFDGYPSGQIYLKQLPSFRLLAYLQDQVIGHIAVEHRMMNNGDRVVCVFGLTDVCVLEAYQHHRVATRMMIKLTELAQTREVDFLVLMAQDLGFYEHLGFQAVKNKCQWVLINQHQTYGVTVRKVQKGLMVKQIGTQEWLPGPVDFLGHVF